MNYRPSAREAQRNLRPGAAGLLAALVGLASASGVYAHEIWVETNAVGQAGHGQEVRVCWGHSGHRESGERLRSQQSQLTLWFVPPNSQSQNLKLAPKPDCFAATITPAVQGGYAVGAACQVGILDRAFHGMQAKTRLVMCGKTVFQVGPSGAAVATPLGMDLELLPLGDSRNLRPGGVVAVKVLFKKTPISGLPVDATLSTLGNRPFPKTPEVEGLAWSVKNTTEPSTGEVRFPLISSGRHILSVKYTDDTRGRYEGDLEFATKFSHLRKGDDYQRTLYFSTLTFDVQGE